MKPLSVKVFSECTQNINLPNELKINEWLRTNPDLEIVHVVQSESMARVTERDIERNLTITIFYRY
jgi:selenophosphate synthetase-related protein